MTETISQPPCGYLGTTVRADKITAVDRDLTPRLAEMEAGLAAMAGDPAAAAQSLVARNLCQYNLRKLGTLGNGEYAVRIAGDCLGDLVTEGEMLVADPAQPIATGQLALIRVRGDALPRGKICLGRLEAIAGAGDIFAETPQGVDHKTVASVRADLESGGEIPHHAERVGRDGVNQPARRSTGHALAA